MSGVVAYNDPQTRRMLHLSINQAFHIPHFHHNLLSPMKCAVNDMIVNKMTKFLVPDPTDQTHASTISDLDNPWQPVILPSVLRGVTLLLYVRPVTIDELNSEEFPWLWLWLHLTSETLTWDPSTNLFEDQEKAMTGNSGSIVHDAPVRGPALSCPSMSLTPLVTQQTSCTTAFFIRP